MHKHLLDDEVDFQRIEHIPVAESVLHPSYDPEMKQYDFWVIKLKWATSQYANDVIDLDRPDDDTHDTVKLKADDELVAVGFGRTNTEIRAKILQKANVKYITNTKCTDGDPFSYHTNEIYGSMLCARGDTGADTCEASTRVKRHHFVAFQEAIFLISLKPSFLNELHFLLLSKGDSGGPLVHYHTESSKKTLVGVTSWGNECGVKKFPGGKLPTFFIPCFPPDSSSLLITRKYRPWSLFTRV